MTLLILDLCATFCFASTGAYIALREKSSLFGIFLSAMLTATGGGTIREIILSSGSLFWQENYFYLMVVIVSAVLAILQTRYVSSIRLGSLKPINEIFTSVFIIVGVVAAIDAKCSPLLFPLMGILTGIGGTVLREAIIENNSMLVHDQLVTMSAILQSILCSLLIYYGVNLIATLLVLVVLHIVVKKYFAVRAGKYHIEIAAHWKRPTSDIKKTERSHRILQSYCAIQATSADKSEILRRDVNRKKILLGRIK